MKQLVILSGKGGTGKTSVSAAFAHLAAEGNPAISAVLADADVDAANLELVLSPRVIEGEDFHGGQIAIIDQANCEGCGVCQTVCRFDAIHQEEGLYQVDPIACDGCAACVYQCPTDAITMHEQVVGQWFYSESRYGPMLHAALRPAQENSGKLVTLVKQRARLLAMDEGYDLVIVDGPPGIGCPVISAVSGADMALIVAEPSAAGVHDMQRILAAEIEAFCHEQDIEVIGRIPFDSAVTEAMVQGEPVTAYLPNSPAGQALRTIWSVVLKELEGVRV